jgi:hypothetical protein
MSSDRCGLPHRTRVLDERGPLRRGLATGSLRLDFFSSGRRLSTARYSD